MPRPARRALAALLLAGATAAPLHAQAKAPIIGRWDLTVQYPGGPRPSWLEVYLSGNSTLVGRFVSDGGSARPIALVRVAGDTARFAIPKQWERGDGELRFEGRLVGDKLEGTITTPDDSRMSFSGVRAPLLRREKAPTWGPVKKLFNGKDLTGWRAFGAESKWSVVNGVLTNAGAGANLATVDSVTDFVLHLEFRYQKNGNSGIYLRGRHEVQVEDSHDREPASTYLGGVYGFLVPSHQAGKGPGEWQSYDIELVGRRVTVKLNGQPIIVDQTIPGITGGALDSNEGAPGPIYLQGDHGPVEFRNITIRLPR
jgi:hypothetical protein